jgi:2-haloacid dehalogenase
MNHNKKYGTLKIGDYNGLKLKHRPNPIGCKTCFIRGARLAKNLVKGNDAQPMKPSSKKQPGIVFDIGGVLLDWSPYYLYDRFFNADHAAIDRFLAEVGFSEWNAQQDIGRPFSVAVAELSARFPHYVDMIRAYDELCLESIGGPIQATVDIMQALDQAGHPRYALSNWSLEKFQLIRHKYDFLDWFETIVLSGEEKIAKPDPRIFDIFLKRVGRSADECLFIDDSKTNIAAAERLGFQTILFQSPEQLQSELTLRGLL